MGLSRFSKALCSDTEGSKVSYVYLLAVSAERISRFKAGFPPETATKALVRVTSLLPAEAGPAVIAVDEDAMKSIGAKAGDIVEIQIYKKELAKVIPFSPNDPHMRIAWDAMMDGDTMSRVGAMVGREVEIRRITDVPLAEKITLIPLSPVPKLASKYILKGIDGVPLTVGNQVTVPLFAKRLSFKVADLVPLKPSPDRLLSAVVSEKTVLILKAEID